MKIIPDPAYAKMQCGSTRLTSGSRRIIPITLKNLPIEDLDPKIRWSITAGIIFIPVVAVFYVPALMFLVVLLWAGAAWMLGSCFHCREQDEDPSPGSSDNGGP